MLRKWRMRAEDETSIWAWVVAEIAVAEVDAEAAEVAVEAAEAGLA